ncbi:hypothetical protein PRZ48_001623 [Zasmidium cellare]|uniref:Methyltransferase domain-containing protein n=1 Tax=Zasmidium cellare TaxID=395010 RepID=A0ABR0F338_ZASCE|nr:hypothetical protein PRZ48_001623 [Zasmidium cellare]
MTAPSLHHSFDASLVDIQRSFSSTETATSGSSGKENQRPEPTPTRLTKELTTSELYTQWATTYDTDGNFLQAVDDLQTSALIPQLVRQVELSKSSNGPNGGLKVLDFGCGTGRTTTKLLLQDWKETPTIEAWDGNEAMLDGARAKCEAISKVSSKGIPSSEFRQVDFLQPDKLPQEALASFDGLVSTLVLEHIPMSTYWTCVSKLLKPGGFGLITNMHPEMGAKSVAGFDNVEGVRMRGTSYIHGVEETVEAAKKAGLELVGEVKEVTMSEDMIRSGAVGERGRKWIGTKVWYGSIFRKL